MQSRRRHHRHRSERFMKSWYEISLMFYRIYEIIRYTTVRMYFCEVSLIVDRSSGGLVQTRKTGPIINECVTRGSIFSSTNDVFIKTDI